MGTAFIVPLPYGRVVPHSQWQGWKPAPIPSTKEQRKTWPTTKPAQTASWQTISQTYTDMRQSGWPVTGILSITIQITWYSILVCTNFYSYRILIYKYSKNQRYTEICRLLFSEKFDIFILFPSFRYSWFFGDNTFKHPALTSHHWYVFGLLASLYFWCRWHRIYRYSFPS